MGMSYPIEPMDAMWRGGTALVKTLTTHPDPAVRERAARHAMLARLRIEQFVSLLPSDVAAAYRYECDKLRQLQDRLSEAAHAALGVMTDNNDGGNNNE